jgi:hypothetical protein
MAHRGQARGSKLTGVGRAFVRRALVGRTRAVRITTLFVAAVLQWDGRTRNCKLAGIGRTGVGRAIVGCTRVGRKGVVRTWVERTRVQRTEL